jgi:nucleotide-binding universal stress UspA family protein
MRFLVAFDDTDGARAAFAATAKLARAAGAEVLLLHVLNPLLDAAQVTAPTTREAMVQVVSAARQAAEAAAASAQVTVAVRVEVGTRGEDAWEHIVHVAQDVDADLVAIGSRRAGGLAGALLGSVAHAVVQHSPCPVLVVRPDYEAAS